MNEYITDFFSENILNVVFIKVVIFRKEFCNPRCMFLNLLIGRNVFSLQNIFCQKFQFFF